LKFIFFSKIAGFGVIIATKKILNQHTIFDRIENPARKEDITMSKNLTRQLVHAVHDCYTPGHDKRADKFNPAIDTGWKIYSSTSRRDMLDLAKDFGKFIQKNSPEMTRAYYVSWNEVHAYLNSKTATCADSTIVKIYSRLSKLELCCKHTYAGSADQFRWNVYEVDVPASTKNDGFTKDTPVPLDVSKAVITALMGMRSEVGNAVTLSAYAGMRANETTCLKVKNVHFTGGEFGHGFIEIVKGPEGGAKGGRPRIIPILNQEAHNAIKSIVAGKNPDDHVAAKADGSKMTPDNVQRALRQVMDKRFGRTYKGNRCHGMRKTWAQMYYDTVRERCSRKEAVSKTNEVLGHGSNRGEEMVRMYVKNIH